MEAVVTCASADDYCGSRTCFTGFGISSFETCCDIRKTAQGDHRCFQDATPWAGTPQCFSGGEHAYNRCCDTSVSATGGDSCWTDEITFETCCPDSRPTSCFYCCFQQEDSPALLALEAFTGEVACADDANSDTSAMPGTRQPRHAPSSALSRWEYTADEISTVVEACPVTCNTLRVLYCGVILRCLLLRGCRPTRSSLLQLRRIVIRGVLSSVASGSTLHRLLLQRWQLHCWR